MNSLRLLWVPMLAITLVSHLFAGEPQSDFEHANRLLAQGKLQDAITAYQSLLKHGTSPALENNLGLAFHQNNQTGQALARFRRAERLSPRDSEILANLRLARARIGRSNPAENEPADAGWATLTLNEWAGLVLTGSWLVGACWMVSIFYPRLGTLARGYTCGLGLATVVLGGLAAHAAIHRYGEPNLVVVRPDLTLRQSPYLESKSLVNLPDGSELVEREQRQDWLLVQEPNSQRTGWVPRDQVERIPVR